MLKANFIYLYFLKISTTYKTRFSSCNQIQTSTSGKLIFTGSLAESGWHRTNGCREGPWRTASRLCDCTESKISLIYSHRLNRKRREVPSMWRGAKTVTSFPSKPTSRCFFGTKFKGRVEKVPLKIQVCPPWLCIWGRMEPRYRSSSTATPPVHA